MFGAVVFSVLLLVLSQTAALGGRLPPSSLRRPSPRRRERGRCRALPPRSKPAAPAEGGFLQRREADDRSAPGAMAERGGGHAAASRKTPAPPSPPSDGVSLHGDDSFQFTLEEREGYLEKYGRHQLSVAMMESPPFEYFDVPGKGFIAYRRSEKTASRRSFGDGLFSLLAGGNVVFALGDPVCGDGDVEELVEKFLRRHPGAVFVQVSRTLTADALSGERHGYRATPFGVTVVVDLPSWDLRGKRKQTIRTAVNAAARRGITIREATAGGNGSDDAPADSRRREIARGWLETRTATEEIGFLVRDPEAGYQRGVRTFYAFDADANPIGFCQYDPMRQDGRVAGYLASVFRGDPGFGQGLSYAINAHAMEVLRGEGIAFLDLGLCPFCVPETNDDAGVSPPSPSSSSPFVRAAIDFVYDNLSGVAYGFEGLRFSKTRYGGEDGVQYLCTPRAIPTLGEALGLFELISNVGRSVWAGSGDE